MRISDGSSDVCSSDVAKARSRTVRVNGLGGDPGPAPQVPDWLLASEYAVLLFADRRSFAWEWLRRSAPYRAAWRARDVGALVPSVLVLMIPEDPGFPTPSARTFVHQD